MKFLLLDADGVVLKKGEYFSERYSREHNVPLESIVEFFKGPFMLCQKGEADLREELLPYLDKWGWKEGVDAFLQYWFDSDVVINEAIKTPLTTLRGRGVACYLASNNEKYRAAAILEKIQGENLLDGAYFSSDLKVRKDNPEFFEHILNDLGVDTGDVYFTDNDQKNVDAALSLGIHADLYREGLLESLSANNI